MPTKKRSKLKYVIITLIAVAIIALVIYIVLPKKDKFETATVVKRDVIQTVLASGKSKAVSSADLGFEQSGKVIYAPYDVGTRVEPNQVILRLDSSELLADLAEAEADLAEVEAGGQTDTVVVSDAISNAKAVMQKSFVIADNSIGAYIDQLFEDPGEEDTNFKPSYQKSDDTEISFSVDYEDRIAINVKRRELLEIFESWQVMIGMINNDNVKMSLASTEAYLKKTQELVDLVSAQVFELEAKSNETVAVIAGYKADVSIARESISNALSEIVSAREKLNSALATFAQVGSSGSSSQQAKIMQIKARIQNIEAQIEKNSLRSPIAGIITKHDIEKGEIATSGTEVITVISDSSLEIESNISEINIGKIVIGNTVKINFDAYPGEQYEGVITYIDPGETLVDGVVNYTIKISLPVSDPKIKSGLTSNLEIETGRREGVLAVPLFSVSRKDGKSTIESFNNTDQSRTTKEITTGLVGQDGYVEVLGGLTEGESIILK
jgi:multidrug resistance efflux pump